MKPKVKVQSVTRMSAMGRPSKRTRATAKLICQLVAQGMPFSLIYPIVKISKGTFADWRREPEFAEQLERALAQGVERRLRTIEQATTRDWRAAAWLLEHCQPELFTKSRIQVEAVGQFDHAFTIPAETLDQIAEARKEYERKQLEERNGT